MSNLAQRADHRQVYKYFEDNQMFHPNHQKSIDNNSLTADVCFLDEMSGWRKIHRFITLDNDEKDKHEADIIVIADDNIPMIFFIDPLLLLDITVGQTDHMGDFVLSS